VGCKIDVKKGRLTFDMGGHHGECGLFKDLASSPSSFACCGYDVLISDESVKIVDSCPIDPHMLDRIFFEGHGLDWTKVDLVKNLSPSICQGRALSI